MPERSCGLLCAEQRGDEKLVALLNGSALLPEDAPGTGPPGGAPGLFPGSPGVAGEAGSVAPLRGAHASSPQRWLQQKVWAPFPTMRCLVCRECLSVCLRLSVLSMSWCPWCSLLAPVPLFSMLYGTCCDLLGLQSDSAGQEWCWEWRCHL